MGNKRPQACPPHRTHALHNPQSKHSGSCKHHFQGRHYARQNVISHFTISRTGAANMSLEEDGARGKGKVPQTPKKLSTVWVRWRNCSSAGRLAAKQQCCTDLLQNITENKPSARQQGTCASRSCTDIMNFHSVSSEII